MQESNRIAVPRGSDGLALIGRTLNDLRGIRFVEGGEGSDPAPDDTNSGTETDTGTHDESVCAAKIAELADQVAQLTADNAALVEAHEAEMTKQKAANYDLLQQIPGEESATTPVDESVESDVDIDDLFKKDED